jgi:hypothetical protein
VRNHIVDDSRRRDCSREQYGFATGITNLGRCVKAYQDKGRITDDVLRIE